MVLRLVAKHAHHKDFLEGIFLAQLNAHLTSVDAQALHLKAVYMDHSHFLVTFQHSLVHTIGRPHQLFKDRLTSTRPPALKARLPKTEHASISLREIMELSQSTEMT